MIRWSCKAIATCGSSCLESGCLPSNTRISVDPPCASNASLSLEYAKLVETELLLQLTSHGNAGSSSTDNDDRIVGVRIVLIAVYPANGF